MSLVRFELGKVFRNRRVTGLVLGLLILNLPLLLWSIRSRYDYVLDSKPEYEALLEEYEGTDLAAAQKDLAERTEQAREFSQLESARQSGNTALLDILQEQNPDLAGEYELARQTGTLPTQRQRTALLLLSAEADYMASYPDYIAGMEDQAEQMRQASIFNKPGTFSYRNVQKTPEDFQKNRGLTLKFGSSAGLEALSRFFLTDVLVLFLALLFAVRLFWEEREKGLLPLVRSTARGRTPTALAKLLTLALTAGGTALLFYGGNLLLTGATLGYGDLGRALPSMAAFRGCDLGLTVEGYLALFLLGKTALAVLFGFLFALAFSLLHSSAMGVLLGVGSQCLCYLAYRFIPSLSPLNFLKYVNPVAALDLYDIAANYHNINLFGYPCRRVTVLGAAMGLLLLLSALTIIALHNAKGRAAGSRWAEKARQKLAGLPARLNGGGLFRQELRKLAFSRKMAVLLLALGLFIGRSVQKTEPVYAFDDGVYNSSLETMEGELPPAKEQLLHEEELRFRTFGDHRLDLRQELDAGKITQNQYEYETFALDNFKARQTGFSWVWDQYQRLLNLRDRGIRAGFVNKNSEDYAFGQPERDAALGILTLALTLTAASVAFCQEYRGGMIQILNPTKNGKGRLFAVKLGAAALFALCFFLVGLPQYLNGRRYYPLGDLTLPVQNLARFTTMPGKISILAYLLLWQGVKLLTLGTGLAMAVFFAVKLRSQAPALLAALGVACLPLILYLCGLDWAKYLPFGGGFLLSQGTGTGAEALGSLVSLALTAALDLGLGTAAYQTFCNRRRKRHGA